LLLLLSWPVTIGALDLNVEELVRSSRSKRLAHLEEQAVDVLRAAVESDGAVVFPNAMNAAGCVTTYLLHKLGYLSTGQVRIMVVDTLHLFPETMPFLQVLEQKYNFSASIFMAAGCENKEDFDRKYGANLWQLDIQHYDKVCKVEPFQRGLKTLNATVMVNGRRRDHGAERAYIDIAEVAPIAGGLVKLNPLAYWTFEDVFDYAAAHDVPLHPLHAEGYPSLGDQKDTVKVPEDGSVRWIDNKFVGDRHHWLDYASERKGRFTGLKNKDGSTKTECGIHVNGAEETFTRDLWGDASQIAPLTSRVDAENLKMKGSNSLIVIYAPWSRDCQDIEENMTTLASELEGRCTVWKYRGDEQKQFVESYFGASAFPTISLVNKEGNMLRYTSDVKDVSALRQWVNERIATMM